ncbi:glycosyltransferase family 4 protein [Anatilimnocola sp. NA78]|uniref:glycosyltransferase family 4 protein n=1 Tax=Anatilimnocola sp. NA78 TaxID=3415683 RepID=UPI003CE59931
MRIGIYVDVARDAKPTGIGKHVLHLIQALAELDQKNEYRLYYPSRAWGRTDDFAHCPAQVNFRSRPVRFPRRWEAEHPRVWWQYYLPWVLRRDGIDVFHGPNHFVPCFDPARTVVTIHDIAYFHMEVHGAGMDQVMRDWTRKALDWSGAVIALSENTRRDVEGIGCAPDKIKVIYGGGSVISNEKIAFERLGELRQTMNLPPKYLLFVGALQPRKNVPFLVKAYAKLLAERSIEEHLVLAGPKSDATAEIEALVASLGISDRVHLTGYLDDWQLPLLYKGASAFVLPTRYEGFTLVTLEAMAYGTPVIATESSSIREGVGDAALLVEVDNIPALSGAIERVLTEESFRAELVRRGTERAKRFTWQQCAKDTLALYESMAKHKPQTSRVSA